MRKIFNQKGMAYFEVLLLILVLAVLAFVGYRVYNARSTAPKTVDSSSQTSQSTKTFTSELEKLTLTYPASWKLDNKGIENTDDFPTETATFTSPNGIKLEFLANILGLGGACDDGAPLGNEGACPLEIVLSVEKLNVTGAKKPLYLVKEAYCVYKDSECTPKMGLESEGKYLAKVGEMQKYPDYITFDLTKFKNKENTDAEPAGGWLHLSSSVKMKRSELAGYFKQPEVMEAEQIIRSIKY